MGQRLEWQKGPTGLWLVDGATRTRSEWGLRDLLICLGVMGAHYLYVAVTKPDRNALVKEGFTQEDLGPP